MRSCWAAWVTNGAWSGAARPVGVSRRTLLEGGATGPLSGVTTADRGGPPTLDSRSRATSTLRAAVAFWLALRHSSMPLQHEWLPEHLASGPRYSRVPHSTAGPMARSGGSHRWSQGPDWRELPEPRALAL